MTNNTGTFNAALAAFAVHAGPHAGQTLSELSGAQPTLLALLRHTGCPFCQEAMADLKDAMPELERRGIAPVLVFQTPDAGLAAKMTEASGLENADVVADPERKLYDAFGIERGNLWQVFGPRVVVGVVRVIARGLRPGKKVGGDVMQLPGTVLIHKGEILERHVHRHQGDRANYEQVACSIPLGDHAARPGPA
jgi:peroxiredoxin